jgi:predicted porin
MNKKLIALAIAGASVVPAAMAQTANPVTLYGRVYLTVESVEADGPAGYDQRTRMTDQASLLGVRGTEDLGGGVKAFFQLETAFAPDQTGGAFANRNSGIGLQGGFGSFLIGRWDMPWKSATIAVDPFGDLTLGGITGTLSDLGNFDRRDNNVGQYWSPNMGGFAFRLAMTTDEAAGGAQNFGANVTFRRGPMYLFGAYEKHEDPSATFSEEEGFAAGGSFAFGPVKIGGQYQQIEKSVRTGPSRDDQKSWMANIVYTLGKNQFIGQYMTSENHNNINGAECDTFHLGYQYNFTKRTFMLAQYSEIDNNDLGRCNFGASRINASGAGEFDPSGFSVGLRHVF